MYSSHSSYSAGDQQAGWYHGNRQDCRGPDGRWHEPQQQQGWQQQAMQPQQPYHTQYYQQPQQQPYGQEQYYPQYNSREQAHELPPLSKKQARAVTATADPQTMRGNVRASTSTPSNRPSKRARASEDDELQETQRRQQTQESNLRSKAQPAQSRRQPEQPWLDALRDEIVSFVDQALPTAQEQEQRQTALQALEAVAQAALSPYTRGRFDVLLFGSGRAGLALHSSDLDIMITGLCQPTQEGGYDRSGKQVVAGHLRKIERDAYRRMAVRSSNLIAHARIPVLKLKLRNGLELDVSLNDTGGIRAANFLQSWQQDYAVLRPLVLVLKSVLKYNGLSDVATGGLGSWSLANMAIAHLMAESNTGGQVDHVGHMLYSFLKRFGVDWNLDRDAVAVAQGGITTRNSLAAVGGPLAGPGKLFVKDPLTGREVAGGSHRYADVMQLWRQLFLDLKERGPAAAGRGQFTILSELVDCAAVLRRGPAAGAGWQSEHNGGFGRGGVGYGQPQGGGSRKRDR